MKIIQFPLWVGKKVVILQAEKPSDKEWFITPIGDLKVHTADKVKLCSFQVWAFFLLISML